MARVDVFHLTPPRRLPLIEEEGLRTRTDLSGLFGPVDDLDRAAPGTFANGKRVSAWYDLDHARTTTDELGAGLVVYSVDPKKTLAAPASTRGDDAEAYWAAAKPLEAWLGDGDVPADLEVHQNLPVRAKYLQMKAPLFTEEELGHFAPIVAAAAADEDRVSAKALMHLSIIASDGDFTGPEWRAACAFAWRDEPDPDNLINEMVEIGSDTVASAAVAEFGGASPEGSAVLREALESTRAWADENGLPHGKGLLARTAMILDLLDPA